MVWIIGVACAVFSWISLSMFVAFLKEGDPAERQRLRRSALGTLVLTLMGIYYIVFLFGPGV